MRRAIVLRVVGSTAAALSASSIASAEPSKDASDVAFVANEDNLTVLKRPVAERWLDGQPPSNGAFSTICVAPCRAQLDASRYQFAVRRPDGALMAGALAYEVRGPSTFQAKVVSHADTRTEGWYVLGGLGGAGVISTTIGLSITCGEDRDCAKWTSLAFWGGLGALSLGAIIGLPMVLEKDELRLSVVPGAPMLAPSGRLELPLRDDLSGAWRGFTIVGRL